MSALVEAASDVLSSAVSTVGNAIEDVGSAVINEVVKPVAQAVEKTVQAAVNDPIGTAAKIAAVATGNPELLPLINGADAIAHGASLDQALVSAGAGYVASQALSGISPAVTDFAGSEIAGNAAQGAATGALSSAVLGGDPLQGAVSGGLNAGMNTAVDQAASGINYQLHQPSDASGLTYEPSSDLTGEEFNLDQIKANADSVNQPVDYSLSGTAATPGGLGLNPDESGLGLTMDSITGRAPSLTSMGGGQGLIADVNAPLGDSNSFINSPEYASDKQGVLSAAGFTDENAVPSLGDPGSFINNPDVTGQPVTPVPTCAYNVNVPNINFASMMNQEPTTQQRQRAMGLAFGCAGIPWLDTRAQQLVGKVPLDSFGPTGGVGGAGGAVPTPTGGFVSHQVPGVDEFNPFTPELSNVLADRGFNLRFPSQGGFAAGGEVQKFACGSSATFCQSYGLSSQYTPKFYPVKCNMLTSVAGKRNPLALAQLKQMQPHISSAGNIGGMARGGLPAKYQEAAPDGHHPEFVTGLTGYYAGGRGTGQSDDIPAMLHDGDYVIDAEAVSALGDGSSKAGNEALMHFMRQVPHRDNVGSGKPVPAKIADGEVVLPESFVTALGGGDNKRGARMLDEMRQRLREHKRSAPNSKIPPKAKSPLDYLKGVKG